MVLLTDGMPVSQYVTEACGELGGGGAIDW